MTAGIQVVVLLPGTWAASVVDLFQDLSAPDLAPSCSVGWADLECSWQVVSHCLLLPRGCPPKTFLWYHPVCVLTKSAMVGLPLPCEC